MENIFYQQGSNISSWKIYFTNKGQIRILRVCVVADESLWSAHVAFFAWAHPVEKLSIFLSWVRAPHWVITLVCSLCLFAWGISVDMYNNDVGNFGKRFMK
jgi:hypothetical protein